VLSKAIGAEELTDLADMLGVELLVIDAGTTSRAFTRELRLNQAYYRLAQGF
jgi:L-arabinose isomerase